MAPCPGRSGSSFILFHFYARTSRVSRRPGTICQATPSIQIAVNRAGRAWRALGKLPTQLKAALWPHPLNPSSALLRWQSLARSYCMAPCPGQSGRPEAWHRSQPRRCWHPSYNPPMVQEVVLDQQANRLRTTGQLSVGWCADMNISSRPPRSVSSCVR